MNEIVFNIIVPASIGALSGGGIFLFLSKKWVSNWFDKDLQKYQNKLEILKIKDEIKFNVLHKELVNRISKLFCLIADEIKYFASLFVLLQTDNPVEADINKLFKTIMDKHIEYKTSIIESSIFLPNELEDSLNELSRFFADTIGDLMKTRENDAVIKQEESFTMKYQKYSQGIRDQVKMLFGVDPLYNIFEVQKNVQS